MKTRITPTIGRIVLYVLSTADAAAIKLQRIVKGPGYDQHKAQEHPDQFPQGPGNPAKAGNVYPATVVSVFGAGPDASCNLQVMLDGPDLYWATSRSNDDADKAPGSWHWMPFQLGQAAKTEAAEAKVPPMFEVPLGNTEPDTRTASEIVAGWTPAKDADPDAPNPLDAGELVKKIEEAKQLGQAIEASAPEAIGHPGGGVPTQPESTGAA